MNHHGLPLSPRPSAHSFTIWMAGGGVKRGVEFGESDEFSCHAAEKSVQAHGFQAIRRSELGTYLERLTNKFQGRYFRLTDVHGRLVNEILA